MPIKDPPELVRLELFPLFYELGPGHYLHVPVLEMDYLVTFPYCYARLGHTAASMIKDVLKVCI